MDRIKIISLFAVTILLSIGATSFYYRNELNYYRSELAEKETDCKDLYKISLSTMGLAKTLREAYNNMLWNRNTPSFKDKEYHKAFLNQNELWVDDLNKYHWTKLSDKYSEK
jgi:hypothetical protein